MEPVLKSESNKFSTIFQVWVQGGLGIHASSPILHSVHDSEPSARIQMKIFLEEGKFAAIKQIRKRIPLEKGKKNNS